MMLMGVGVTTTNAVTESHLSQTVKADEVNGDTPNEIYHKMLNAGIATPKVKWNLNGPNKIKAHWYKKAHWHDAWNNINVRSEEHTSELQSRFDLVCRLLLEKKKI